MLGRVCDQVNHLVKHDNYSHQRSLCVCLTFNIAPLAVLSLLRRKIICFLSFFLNYAGQFGNFIRFGLGQSGLGIVVKILQVDQSHLCGFSLLFRQQFGQFYLQSGQLLLLYFTHCSKVSLLDQSYRFLQTNAPIRIAVIWRRNWWKEGTQILILFNFTCSVFFKFLDEHDDFNLVEVALDSLLFENLLLTSVLRNVGSQFCRIAPEFFTVTLRNGSDALVHGVLVFLNHLFN